ncbi:OGG1 [Symbiodinium sp. KB8]|nr:OGG1 [Symbiodinium sp. KB8]
MEKGSFDKVELVVKQWHESKTRDETSGGYVTKKWLMDNKTMADNAFKWAAPRGRCRKNVITGEEEADIPLDERWSVMRERGQRMEFENGCELDVSYLKIQNADS